jgi:HAD superfamily hydrolase (TIGR01509 family)
VSTGQFDLVIFDCDGVLIDSEPIANRVLVEQLRGLGLRMTDDEVMRTYIGNTRDGCIAITERKLGRRLPEDFAAAWDRALFAALRAELKAMEGVVEVLRGLRIPFCAASNAQPERMRVALEAAGLADYFDGRAFSAAEVPRPKPAPDLFLHAAARMGATSTRCAVVEDTPTGVRAGVAAGMTVFAYAGAQYADGRALEEAGGRLFRRMAELPALLGQ